MLDLGPAGRRIAADEESPVGEKCLGHLGARLDGLEDLKAPLKGRVRLLAVAQRRQGLSEDAMRRALLELVTAALGESEGLARCLDRLRRVAPGRRKAGRPR